MKIEIMLGGKKRSLWFNNYAKGALGGVYGLDPLEAIENLLNDLKANYVKAIEKLVLAGLEGFHEATDTPKDYTGLEVKQWCAEATDEDLAGVFNTWKQVSEVNNLIPNPGHGEAKKKPHGKKSKTSPSVN